MAASEESGRTSCTCPCVERAENSKPQADTVAIVVAGGSGERFGDPRGKQFVDLCGLPLMCWPLMALDRAPSVAHIVIVCAPDKADVVKSSVLSRVVLKTPVSFAPSGATRQDSVYSGLSQMPAGYPFVAVHDAARPLVEVPMIEGAVAAVRQDGRLAGAICAARSIDTLKLVEGTDIIATPDRTFYWAAQTPQVFRTREVVAAYKAALWDGYQGTDDSSLVERHGGRVRCVECSRDNIKVTIPEDLAVAEATLEQRLVEEGCSRRPGRDVQ